MKNPIHRMMVAGFVIFAFMASMADSLTEAGVTAAIGVVVTAVVVVLGKRALA